MEGRLVSGEPCTVLFFRELGGWSLYPFGLDQGVVRLTDEDVRKLARGLGDQL